jgi:hypothetical protein
MSLSGAVSAGTALVRHFGSGGFQMRDLGGARPSGRLLLVLSLACVGLVAGISAATAGAPSPAFSIDTPATVVAGDVVDVSGVGCPAEAEFEVDGPQVLVWFGPAESPVNPPGIAVNIDEDDNVSISGSFTLVGVFDEASDSLVVESDGSWSGSLTVPEGVQPGVEYTLLGLCLTLLPPEVVDPDAVIPPEALEPARFEAGPLTVPAPETTTSTSPTTPSTVPAPPPAAPQPRPATFTG